MRVLIFHGYLLRGTGSNVYNAELAQALARLGHDVHLICQDRQAAQLHWVDAVGDWQSGTLQVRSVGEGAHTAAHAGTADERPDTVAARAEAEAGRGRITVYRPEIAGLLPVYVYDHYDGFEVKTYPDLTEAELERYIALNVTAVRDVTAAVGGFDAALANHLVMGPVILARAGLRFAAKIHGSDLSYTVRPHRDRFVPYAREAMRAASAALVGSRHTAEDLWATVALDGLEEKTRLGPPGLDPEEFRPAARQAATSALRRLAEDLRGIASRESQADAGSGANAFGRDPARAAAALDWFADGDAERVIYVGKLLVNKGVDLLLCAWPLIRAKHPRARLLLAGFGAFGETLWQMHEALAAGDLARLGQIARAVDEDGTTRRLSLVEDFLDRASSDYAELARQTAGSVMISGRLEHSEVAVTVPAASALVMPSTFPEAFGMVSAEAAACGVLPVSARHSGMAEVSMRLAEAVEPGVAPLLSFDLDADPVATIAAHVNGWLALEPEARNRAAEQLRARSVALWSWPAVARSILAASAGRLDRLPRP